MGLVAFGREDRPEYREDWGDGPHAPPRSKQSPRPAPPSREQCAATFNGKRCTVLEGHNGLHQHWSGFSVTATWADASTEPTLIRKVLEEHADMLYSLGGV